MVPNNASGQFTGAARAFASLDVVIDSTNSTVEPGGALNVNVTVTNSGTAERAGDVELVVGGATRDTITVSLPAGGSTPETLSWDTTSDDKGDYTAEVKSTGVGDTAAVSIGQVFDASSGDPVYLWGDVSSSSGPGVASVDSSDGSVNWRDSLPDRTVEISADKGTDDYYGENINTDDAQRVAFDPGNQSASFDWGTTIAAAGAQAVIYYNDSYVFVTSGSGSTKSALLDRGDGSVVNKTDAEGQGHFTFPPVSGSNVYVGKANEARKLELDVDHTSQNIPTVWNAGMVTPNTFSAATLGGSTLHVFDFGGNAAAVIDNGSSATTDYTGSSVLPDTGAQAWTLASDEIVASYQGAGIRKFDVSGGSYSTVWDKSLSGLGAPTGFYSDGTFMVANGSYLSRIEDDGSTATVEYEAYFTDGYDVSWPGDHI